MPQPPRPNKRQRIDDDADDSPSPRKVQRKQQDELSFSEQELINDIYSSMDVDSRAVRYQLHPRHQERGHGRSQERGHGHSQERGHGRSVRPHPDVYLHEGDVVYPTRSIRGSVQPAFGDMGVMQYGPDHHDRLLPRSRHAFHNDDRGYEVGYNSDYYHNGYLRRGSQF